MGKDSAIEWCDASWSPWRGCTPVSAGCAHCYAERRAKRVGEDFGTIVRSKTTFEDPLKWKEPLVIFVGHLSDFFHADVPEEWRRDAWEIMWECRKRGHTFLLLTKRPENIARMLPSGWTKDLHRDWSHICLGITAENQEAYDERLLHLMMIPASCRFISFEPLLSSIDMRIRDTLSQGWGPNYETIGDLIDGVIVGGESGPRKMEPSWVMRIQNDCAWKDIPFFFKQWGGTKKVNGTWGGRQYMGYFWNDRAW